ncbi:hypothetical protein D9613_011072 [Agrocybe pediades]|uniref:Velvet domain-containing protein n=1 Tax=Agrocybe pediades TaxID=84607 RepID=A0A8H4QL93_9AGAR|nr:hypothetical protein D9613_011072 [Agrocybe pediades]
MSSDPELHAEPPQNREKSLVGQPIYFATGSYRGLTIRMELHEIQKADLGRKYARVDRRPLDPPPVVHLKMFEVQNTGPDDEPVERELDYDDTHVLGLLCTVDLFPVPEPVMGKAVTGPPAKHRKTPSSSSGTQFSTSNGTSPASSSCSPTRQQRRLAYEGNASPQGHFSGYILPSSSDADIVHDVDGFPISENSKQTQALVGATFVQPVIIDYQGKRAIIFAFADLAVKIEGHFIMRYRVFDIFAHPFGVTNDITVSAECYGGIFRVYSTKEFPGLSVSTELTRVGAVLLPGLLVINVVARNLLFTGFV